MYKNPRLKHVKKIKEICNEILSASIFNTTTYIGKKMSLIDSQCNLLLETKKNKKCKVCGWLLYKGKCINKNCGENNMMLCVKPSPQPEIEELYMEGDFGDIAPSNEDITFKLNQVIYQLNKLTKTK